LPPKRDAARHQFKERERMWTKSSAVVLVSLFAAQQVTAQQPHPNAQILAQAYDRCMATHAVRLTHTTASDKEIFAQATESCLPLDG
jgi:phage protein D